MAELLLREEQPVLEWLHELGQQAICTPAGKKQQQQSGAISVPARLLQWRPERAIQLLMPRGGPSVERTEADNFPSFVVDGLPAPTMDKLREHSSDGRLSILAASSTVAERRLAESLASS